MAHTAATAAASAVAVRVGFEAAPVSRVISAAMKRVGLDAGRERTASAAPAGTAPEPTGSAAPDPTAPTAPDPTAGDVPGPHRGGAGAPAPRRAVAVAMAATLLAAVAATGWIAAAGLTANHGFDTSDEGFYLLSYRWWSTNFRTFTGVQYLYGPVFEWLGYDIAALRLVRLVTVVATHLVFGWAFMAWLRRRRPSAVASRWWEAAGIAAIVAAGGMIYSWLPLSPGYNDVSLLGGLLAASVVLRMATHVDRGSRIPPWVPAALGPIVVATLLAKWTSSALTLGLVGAAAVVAVAPLGLRAVARSAAWASAAAVITVVLLQLLVVPLTTALPAMLATTRLVAAQTNSPTALLRMYASTGVDVLRTILVQHGVLLAAAAVAVAARSRLAGWFAAALGVAGLAFSTWRLLATGGWRGGTANLERYSVAVLAVVLVAGVVGLGVLLHGRYTRTRRDGPVGRPAPGAVSSLCRESRRGWAILAMIALLPVTQAAGTGNPLYFMAVNAFAAWTALVVAVLTGIERAPVAARWLTAAVTAGAVALASVIATDALWKHPYRTAARDRTTTVAAGVPALGSVRLDPATAQSYRDLHRVLQPYLVPEGRAIMAFDEMPGVVLLLDGRPVGEAWYSAIDHARSAAGIREECRDGPGWWGQRRPLLLFRRPVTQTEVDALHACGLSFAGDYRLIAPEKQTMGIQVYVPIDEAPKGQR